MERLIVSSVHLPGGLRRGIPMRVDPEAVDPHGEWFDRWVAGGYIRFLDDPVEELPEDVGDDVPSTAPKRRRRKGPDA